MRENKYDEPEFFERYGQMPRSVGGLSAAGEWWAFRALFPDLRGKRVLDLGCGYGWHCRYAAERGAESVVGVDISERMLAEAEKRTDDRRIEYRLSAIEDIAFADDSFDAVISSLAFHYVASFAVVVDSVKGCLRRGGDFVFSVEHPVFTAYGTQDWCHDAQGGRLHWPVDRYFLEGVRDVVFLGETVKKYHRTLTTYVGDLIAAGFEITGLVEPTPDPALLDSVPGMREELRRPMMLLLSSRLR